MAVAAEGCGQLDLFYIDQEIVPSEANLMLVSEPGVGVHPVVWAMGMMDVLKELCVVSRAAGRREHAITKPWEAEAREGKRASDIVKNATDVEQEHWDEATTQLMKAGGYTLLVEAGLVSELEAGNMAGEDLTRMRDEYTGRGTRFKRRKFRDNLSKVVRTYHR